MQQYRSTLRELTVQTPLVRLVVDCCAFVLVCRHNNPQQTEASGV